jgi:hypothetical protein
MKIFYAVSGTAVCGCALSHPAKAWMSEERAREVQAERDEMQRKWNESQKALKEEIAKQPKFDWTPQQWEKWRQNKIKTDPYFAAQTKARGCRNQSRLACRNVPRGGEREMRRHQLPCLPHSFSRADN